MSKKQPVKRRAPYKRKPETEVADRYYSAERKGITYGCRFQVCGGGFRVIRKGT